LKNHSYIVTTELIDDFLATTNSCSNGMYSFTKVRRTGLKTIVGN